MPVTAIHDHGLGGMVGRAKVGISHLRLLTPWTLSLGSTTASLHQGHQLSLGDMTRLELMARLELE